MEHIFFGRFSGGVQRDVARTQSVTCQLSVVLCVCVFFFLLAFAFNIVKLIIKRVWNAVMLHRMSMLISESDERKRKKKWNARTTNKKQKKTTATKPNNKFIRTLSRMYVRAVRVQHFVRCAFAEWVIAQAQLFFFFSINLHLKFFTAALVVHCMASAIWPRKQYILFFSTISRSYWAQRREKKKW